MPYYIKQSPAKKHKNKKQQRFYAVMVARNGEILSTTEMLSTHAAVIKNIKAQIKDHCGVARQRIFDQVLNTEYVFFCNLHGNGKVSKMDEKLLSKKYKR